MVSFLKFFPSYRTGLESVQKMFCKKLPNEHFGLGGDFSLQTAVYHAPYLVKITGIYLVQEESYRIF
jgi:hypothetical protein